VDKAPSSVGGVEASSYNAFRNSGGRMAGGRQNGSVPGVTPTSGDEDEEEDVPLNGGDS